MTFEPGKEYKTRDGCRARVYAVDGGGAWPIHGAVEHAGGAWISRAWDATGCYVDGGGRGCGLMPPEPEKITQWAVVVDGLDGFRVHALHDTRESAIIHVGALIRPIAIIPVTFHKGEGL